MSAALTGKVAIVTGASRGMGRRLADALVASGARVALLARPSDALQETASTLAAAAAAVPCDVSNDRGRCRGRENAGWPGSTFSSTTRQFVAFT